MVKRCSLFLLFFLLSTSVFALTELQTDQEACYNDGSFAFRAWNGKPDQVYTNDIQLEVSHHDTRAKFAPEGSWDEDMIWFTMYEPDRKYARYVSKPETLNESGDYYVRLRYEGCRERASCFAVIDLERCPGYTYDCQEMNTRVTSCYARGNSLFLHFAVPKASYAAQIRPYQDLMFYLKSNLQDRDGVDKIQGMRIDRRDNTTFIVTVPLRDQETIDAAAVVVKRCDSPATQQKLVQCQRYLPPPSYEDETEDYAANEPAPPASLETAPPPEEETLPQPEQQATVVPSAAPQSEKREQRQTPVIILPLHLAILVLAIIIGITLIALSVHSSHKKMKKEEE